MYIRDLRPTDYVVLLDIKRGDCFEYKNSMYMKCDTCIKDIPEGKELVVNLKTGYVQYMSSYNSVEPVVGVMNTYGIEEDVIDPLTGEVIYCAEDRIKMDFQFE